jgi:peptide-methionine (S)-S-oxide reductase
MLFLRRKIEMPTPDAALPGRDTPLVIDNRHHVHGRPLLPPYPERTRLALFGLGCFWGAERCYWGLPGVWTTAVGYAAGHTPNPTYEEVCSGRTGHNEVVRVVYDPQEVDYATLLRVFFESHDPTQGMRQGNDVGTQYRSGIYTYDGEQAGLARRLRERYQAELARGGIGPITTEILPAPDFYYAEDPHQQYLSKNPHGYCGLGGTGVSCPAA